MGEFEAVSEAVTGALVGRAIEPAAGEAADGHTHERACLNCGAALTGPYCHECGQRAHVHRTLEAFFHDFLHGVLHFEGKIWRTLPLLAWRPGVLTRRYIDGQRARFVSPIALFLFSVFVMFAVLSMLGGSKTHFGAERDLAAAERATTADIRALEQKRAAAGADSAAVEDIDADIRSEKNDLAVIQELRRRGITEATFSRSTDNFNSSVPWIEEAYHKAKQNPDLLLYKLKSNSYKWSWAIIPLSVPFVWLLFPFSRRFRLYDHTVFVTYSVTFVTLLATVGSLLGQIGLDALAPALAFVPPVHMYRQLRGTYGIGRGAALWRTAALLVFATIVLTAFVLLMATLGILD